MKNTKISRTGLLLGSFFSAAVLNACSTGSSAPENSSSSQSASVSQGEELLPGPTLAELDRAPASGPAVPFVPGPKRPTQPHATPNPSPANPAPKNEAPGGCPVPLNRIAIGGSNPNGYGRPYSVMDLLVASSTTGSFSGNWELDRRILAPWFGKGYRVGSEVDGALGDSKAWCRAISFIDGLTSDQCGQVKTADMLINPKMAAILASVLAVRNQPECIREIRGLAAKVLRDNIGELDESILPLTDAANALKNGRLNDKFEEVQKTRHDLEKQIKDLDDKIATSEKKTRSEFEEDKKGLRDNYHELQVALAKIPACSSTVKFDLLTSSLDERVDKVSEQLVNDCKSEITKRLDQYRKDEVELTKKIAEYASKREQNPDLPISDAERKLEERLEKRTHLIGVYKGYLSLLENRGEEKSVAFHKAKIDALMKRGLAAQDSLKNKGYAAADLKTKTELEQRYRSYSSRYLTYNYFGANGVLPMSAAAK